MLSLRLADPAGAPDPALRWHAEATVGAAAAGAGVGAPNVAVAGSAGGARKAEPPPPERSQGPLQWFERETRSGGSPAVREAFARYLKLSDGDDPALHQARDLAYSAAASPTVQRLLL